MFVTEAFWSEEQIFQMREPSMTYSIHALAVPAIK